MENKAREVFYVYAHRDESLRKELEKHLTILMRQGLITTWHSYKILAGIEWKRAINVHINQASIVLLLVSSDFIASDYCYGIEMKQALERHRKGEARVIPIILRPVDWKQTPFSELQVLPKEGKPVTSWSGRYGRDKAFLEITLGIRDVITAMNKVEGAYLNAHGKMGWVVEEDRRSSSYTINYTAELNEHIARLQRDRASEYHKRESYEEALAIYEQALKLNSRDAASYSGKGDTLKDLHRYKEALVAYERALRLDPRDTASLYGKGKVLNILHRYQEALTTFDLALKWTSDDDNIYYEKGNALYELERFGEALSAHEQALNLNPNRATTYFHKAHDLFSLQQYEQALAACEQVIRLDPNNVEAYSFKGNVHSHLQQYAKALAAYKHVIRLNPKDSNAYEQILQLDSGNILDPVNRALIEAEQTLLQNPEDSFAYLKKGKALCSLGRYAEADAVYKDALRLAPECFYRTKPSAARADPRYFRSNVLLDFQMYEEARIEFESGWEREEKSKLWIIYSFARHLGSRGDFHFNNGEYELALIAYEQALHLLPSDRLVQEHMDKVLKKLGRIP